jgi:DNA-binding response OmpR family regulator
MSRVHDVLMIEDDLDYRRLVSRWLGEHYSLHFGTRLDDTWHALERCDLLLLDLGLPDANGMDTLVAARELAGAIPIVVLTGQGEPGLGRRAIEAGETTVGSSLFILSTGHSWSKDFFSW